MNDLMSFGIHRLWKREMAKRISLPYGALVLDRAGGTGDIASLLVREGGRTIIVCDPSLEMMQEGRRRQPTGIGWLAGEGEALPFADNSFDVLTISFGLRNMTNLEAALAEINRILKPGGRFVCLEFSRPRPWLAWAYDLYSELVIPHLGAMVASAPEAYRYLIESIRGFPPQEELKTMIEKAGFHQVGFRDFSFGIACLHWGVKAQ
jgi:demethylmenaquinone methyltransferase/2-methoxy-6-polyprenyl-1,4-benzoquinol methylase